MRIGMVIAGIPPGRVGGAEVQAWELARRLAREHAVTLFTRRYDGVETGLRDGVRLICTPNYYGRLPKPIPYLIHVAVTTRAVCRQSHDLEVLLCYMTEPGGLIGAQVRRRTGLPFCTSIRGGDWYFVQPHRWGRALLRYVFARSARVVVHTPRIRNEVRAAYPGIEPVVIPNGIAVEPRRAQGDAVLFLGNLLARKGVPVLLEALRRHPEIPLVIAGDGPERSRLEALAAGSQVRFVGRVAPETVRDLMAGTARLLVLPAVAGEGMPNVLLEAMSVGVPVIASDVAGVRDVLENGAAGLVVPPGDAAALEHAILRLWNNAGERERFAAAGLQAVEQYSWDRIVAAHVEMLGRVVREQSHGT